MLATMLTVLFLTWMTARAIREVIDNRDFWVSWVHESGMPEVLSHHVHLAVDRLESTAVEQLPVTSPQAALAVREALGKVKLRVDREIAVRFGENLDSVIGYLSARGSTSPHLDFGIERALTESTQEVTEVVAGRLCTNVVRHGNVLASEVTIGSCDQAAVAGAHAVAARFASWLSGSIVPQISLSSIVAASGLSQVRVAARVLRVSIHILGLSLPMCFLLFVLCAWRLRTLVSLLGLSLCAAAVLLTPFINLFSWLVVKLAGTTAGSVAVSASGLVPFGIGIHLILVTAGMILFGVRMIGPPYRAQFWARRGAHSDPRIRRIATCALRGPAGLREAEYVLRVLL